VKAESHSVYTAFSRSFECMCCKPSSTIERTEIELLSSKSQRLQTPPELQKRHRTLLKREVLSRHFNVLAFCRPILLSDNSTRSRKQQWSTYYTIMHILRSWMHEADGQRTLTVHNAPIPL